MKNNKTNFFKKVLVSLTVIFLTGFAFQVNAQSGIDSKGKDFWITFPENYLSSNPKLYISGEQNTSGNVSIASIGFNQDFSVTAGSITTITLPPEALLTSSASIGNNGIHITAIGEITIYGMNAVPYSSDAYLGLPTNALGTEYAIMSYNGLSVYGSQIGIVATENATSVSFNLKTTVGSYLEGNTYTIVLNKGQTFYLKVAGSGDLTGSEITSTKPIAVFSGVQCANVPVGTGACDHLVEQMTPASGWGKNFVAVPLKTRSGDTYRILAGTNGTSVSVNGSVVATLNKGQFFERVYNSSLNIISTEPILVAQYSNGSQYDEANADPAMMLIPPFEQFLGAYTINTPSSGFAFNFVNLVLSNYSVGSIKLDGTVISPDLFSEIGSTGFSGAQVDLSIGTHNLTNNGLPFGAFVYGFNDYDSYGYSAGSGFSAIATVSAIEISPKLASNMVGISACLNGTVLDQNGNPVVGVRVDFSISGANVAKSGFVNTDSNGDATFCYVGENVGDDTIIVSIGTLSDTVLFTWSASQTAPEVICPENIEVDSTVGECGAVVNFTASETVGNPESVITYSQDSGTYFPVGDTNVTLTATNLVDSSTCTFTITVIDNIAPTITLNGDANITIRPNESYTDAGATAADNCLVATILATGTVDNTTLGVYTLTYRALDASNNESGVITRTVTVENSAPSFTSTPIISINDNEQYSYTITTEDGDGDIANITASTIPAWLTLTGSPSSVNISSQTWTKKNLDIINYRDGTPIPQVFGSWRNLKTAAWSYYKNDAGYNTTYGKLYNWYAVMGITTEEVDSSNPTPEEIAARHTLAPEGWHVPSNDEWTILTTSLGGGSIAGGKMKEEGSAHWQTYRNTTYADNSSGFTALPAGRKIWTDGQFANNPNYVFFWSSSDYSSTDAYTRYLVFYNAEALNNAYNNKAAGYSVRLVKDTQPGEGSSVGAVLTGNPLGNAGTHTVTLDGDDGFGGTAQQTFTITVTDVTAPTVITQNIIVELDATGNASITPQQIDNGSSDT
ncbi:MAG: hypothetical protein ACI8YC_001244, partial [Salibacteraceae bacterium]